MWTDMTSLTCIIFMHLVQRRCKNFQMCEIFVFLKKVSQKSEYIAKQHCKN